jgi:tripartite-type tricarboxylate transporter receptor subunit TctC
MRQAVGLLRGAIPARIIAAFAVLAAANLGATAQNWPTRPVTIVEPFGASSVPDILVRIMAPRLSELLGQPVIVENVSGAGGMIGVNRVARAAPNGYQLVISSAGSHAYNQTLYKNPLYNAAVDFAPVTLLAEVPLMLVTRKDFPANTLQEFIAYTKAHQKEMSYGSAAGTGSANHIVCVLFNSTIGVTVSHVPYRPPSSIYQDSIAGLIDYHCDLATADIVQRIETNQLKAIAMLSKTRAPIFLDVPTADEQGLSNFEGKTWLAFFLPKRTPAAIVQKLHDAIVATVDTPDVRARMSNYGAELVAPERRSPDYLQGFVESEIARWAVPIKASGAAGL